MSVPAREAPFADKLADYRTQHTTRAVRVVQMIGTPVIADGIPLLVVNHVSECRCSSAADCC